MSFDFNKVKPQMGDPDWEKEMEAQANQEQNKITLKQFSTKDNYLFNFVKLDVYKNKGYLDAETKDCFFIGDFSDLFFETYTFYGDKDELIGFSDEETEAIKCVSFDKDVRRLVLCIPKEKKMNRYIHTCAIDLVKAIRNTKVYKALFNKTYGHTEKCTVMKAFDPANYKFSTKECKKIQLEIQSLSSLDQVRYENFLDGIEIYVISRGDDYLYKNDTTVFRGIYHLEGDEDDYELVRHSTRHYLRKE
jgi:hypothetical protein